LTILKTLSTILLYGTRNRTYSPAGKEKNHLFYAVVALTILTIVQATAIIINFLKDKNSACTVATIAQNLPPSRSNYKLAGSIVIKDGTVEIKKSSFLWESANKGDTVLEGNIIRTGSASRAVIELDDGSAVRLDENTEISFSALTDEVILLSQYRGQVYHRVHPGGLIYNVKSLDTIATALGTSFSVITNTEENLTEVAVYESKVEITVKGETVVSQEITEGEKAVITGLGETVLLEEIGSEDTEETFYKWNDALNKGEEYLVEEGKEKPTDQEPTTTEAQIGPLTLTASPGLGEVTLRWEHSGSAPYGYKLIMSSTSNPTYPPRQGDSYKHLTGKTYSWPNLHADQIYHFRVGAYDGSGKIIKYSNDVAVSPNGQDSSEEKESYQKPGSDSDFADSILLTVSSPNPGTAELSWETLGGGSPFGSKVCAINYEGSKEEQYNCQHLSKDIRSYTYTNLISGTTYTFGVWMYQSDGKMELLSNQLKVTIK